MKIHKIHKMSIIKFILFGIEVAYKVISTKKRLD